MSEEVPYKVGPGCPPLHSRIKKGEVRNPLGRGAHKYGTMKVNIRKLTAIEVEELVTLVLTKDRDALKSIIDDKSSSVLKCWIAACAIRAIRYGDVSVLERLLERVIGKVPDKIEHTGKDGGPIESSAEDREARMIRIQEKYEKMKLLTDAGS